MIKLALGHTSSTVCVNMWTLAGTVGSIFFFFWLQYNVLVYFTCCQVVNVHQCPPAQLSSFEFLSLSLSVWLCSIIGRTHTRTHTHAELNLAWSRFPVHHYSTELLCNFGDGASDISRIQNRWELSVLHLHVHLCACVCVCVWLCCCMYICVCVCLLVLMSV